MKGKIFFTLLIIALLFVFDFIFFKIIITSHHQVRISMIHFSINALLLMILFLAFFYKSLFTLKSNKIVIGFYTLIAFLLATHLSKRMTALNNSYLHSKAQVARVSGNVWQPHPVFGHKGIPDGRGQYEYHISERLQVDIPVYLDANGFRSVAPADIIKSDTTDLYLGCSYTFGDFIEANKSYPYRASYLLNHNYINSAASAYGYAQMMQWADSLTRVQPFKYVFIQLSPWLADRAKVLINKTSYGYRPCPYFSDEGDSFKLNHPAYHTYRSSGKDWFVTQASYLEKIQYIWSDGMQSEIGDYYACQWTKLKVKLGITPAPTKRTAALEKFVYTQLIETCKKNNAIPVILKLEYPREKHKEMLDYLEGKAIIIDLDQHLEKKVTETGLPYDKVKEMTHYEKNKSIYHVSGKDTILYGLHPNEAYNELFATHIFTRLKGL